MMREQVEFALKEMDRQPKKMIVFDMDNVLLQGSFIQAAAERFGFTKELAGYPAAAQKPLYKDPEDRPAAWKAIALPN